MNTNKAEEYADNKFTPKAKQYAATSSIKAVYDNCIEDFNAGFNSRQIEIDSLTNEVERLRKEREWISVEDRLPNEGDKVLFHGEGHVMMGFYHEGNFKDCMSPHPKIINITNWQPLPPINH